MKQLLIICCCFLAFQLSAQEKKKTPQWLGILTLTEKYKEEKNWSKEDEAITGEHFQRLVKLKNEGVVILAGRTMLELKDAGMMGLVIFYAKDEKEAQQFMQDDPAVKNKIMLAKVVPYAVAINKCE
nr:YciI family protein [uncultured Lacibacter sp.]